MSDKKNALEELTRELASLIPKDKDIRELDQRRWNAVDKAQRIVAELAKLQFDANGKPNMYDAFNCARDCRAIAEEGAGDGK